MATSLLHSARQLLIQKQYEEALYCFQELITKEPDITSHYLELSSCLMALEKLDEAIVVVKQGMEFSDEVFIIACQEQLANIFLKQQRYDMAAPLFEQAITKKPFDLNPYLGLSQVYLQTHQPTKAIHLLKAVPIDLMMENSYVLNLTLAMFHARKVDDALEMILEHWQTHSVDKDLLSNAIMFTSYTEQHDDFQTRMAPYLKSCYTASQPAKFESSDHGRLRVGFISGDFAMHPVGYFTHSFLPHLNQYVDVYLYSNTSSADRLTTQLQKNCFKFSLIGHFDTDTAVKKIINDEIDVLIDLSGHTAKNRLDIFRQRAAPCQLSYLGFPESTGLVQMDGQITDRWHIEESRSFVGSEKIWHLPNSRFCFLPPMSLPEIADAPMFSNHYITFGYFGNPSKISASCTNIWGQILLAFPGSRLKLKHHHWNDSSLKKSLLKIWIEMGVEPGRIEFYGSGKYDVYLESFAEIDFILDSYPFTGATTTCEALWMGVPVLTIPGSFPATRQGLSILQAINEEHWIFQDLQQLIACVKEVHSQPSSLVQFKQSIRSKIQQSSLGNGAKFAENFYKLLGLIQGKLI
jgi:protein O-GlcNAc transferase